MEKKIALIDLDGTLVRFSEAMLAKLNEIKNPMEPALVSADLESPPEWLEERMAIIKRDNAFWSSLELIQKGMQLAQGMVELGFHLNILTRASRRYINSWSAKAKFATDWYPKADITVTTRKEYVWGHLLMDDDPRMFGPWLERWGHGQVLMMSQPWNLGYEHARVTRVNPNGFYGECAEDDNIDLVLHSVLKG